MKSVRMLSLPAAGILLFGFGAPALAGEDCTHGTPKVARLVDMLMAEDKTALVDSVVTLETDLDDARVSVDSADLTLSEAKIDAATALLAVIHSESAVEQAKTVHERAADAVAEAERELDALRAEPPSQEVNSDISFIEAELTVLKRTVAGAESDLLEVGRRLKAAQIAAADAELIVARAEDTFLAEQRDLDTVQDQIASAHNRFDAEQAKVEALVAELPQEKRSALSRSLDTAVNNDFMLVNIDATHLKTIRDEGYSVQQIEYFAQALRAEAEYRQIAVATGDRRILDLGAREKRRFLAEIDRLEAEKLDAERGGKSAFGIASHPGRKASKPAQK